MNDPWQILGLSRDAATEKEVKSAYARLIKQHRPDTDPEGFQRVRQAYEAALAMLKSGWPRGGAAEPLAGDTASAPPALIEAELAVHRAREADDQEAVARAVGALFPICRELRPGKAGLQLWVETLHRVTDGSAKLVAMGVATSQMLHELESGSAVITHTVISYWESTHDTDSLLWLAEAVMAEAGKLGNQDSGIVALRLAVEIGFIRPALASALVTFAFPHIDRQAREQLIPQVEQQTALGNLMVGLRKDQTAFWHERLRNPRHAWDWNDKASEEALTYLAGARGPPWAAYNVIKQVASAEWFARLEKEMGRRQGGFMGKFRPATLGRPRPQPQSAGGSNAKRFGWLAIFLLVNLARLLPECSSRNYTPYYPNTSSHRVPFIESLPEVPSLSSPGFPPVRFSEPPGVRSPGPPGPPVKPIDTNTALNQFGDRIRVNRPLTPFALPRDWSQGEAVAAGPATQNNRPPAHTSSGGDAIAAEAATAAGKARADKLLQADRSLHNWVEQSNAIGSTARAKLAEARTPSLQDESRKKYGIQLYQLMQEFHRTNRAPAREHRFLELLMCSPDSSPLERLTALYRMMEFEPVDILLPLWEGTAGLGSQVSHQVSSAAAAYLKDKGSSLTSSERERMEALAKRAK